MRKLVKALSLAALLVTAGDAVAVNEIGIYSDPGAWGTEFATTPNVPFPVYFILTDPTEAQVWGFEFSYELVEFGSSGQIVRLATTLPPLAVDLGQSADLASGYYVVGLAEPLPAAGEVVLVAWDMMFLAGASLGVLSVGPSPIPSVDPPLPAYEAGGFIVPMVVAPSCWGNNEVHLGEWCPLAAEAATFGGVKALFR